VANRDHGLAAALDGFAQPGGGRARVEPLVRLGLDADGAADLGRGLASAEQWAREDGVGADALVGEALAQVAGRAAAFGCQRAQLVGLARGGVGVANQVDPHAGRIGAGGYSRGVPTLRYVVVDVFTERPLEGNQLAVFTDARDLDEALMQPLARELNLAETVFVFPAEGEGHARIRIFTPRIELPFAGHPTLGTAFVLAAPLQLDEIRLETGKGLVPVRLERDGGRITFGRMTQPLPTIDAYAAADSLLAALNVERSELPVERYDNGVEHVYVALESEQAVAALRPNLAQLADLPAVVGINCFAGAGTRWKTRMFAPGDGIPEDPATGSAAGPLALHLARHGRIAFGDEIEITQGVEIARPSKLFARVEGSADSVEAIEVGGSSVIVARGEFRIP
jgi:trans-2,3-dihydro-3-hydroxyanthranilate isomerase